MISLIMAVKDNLEWTMKGIKSIEQNTLSSYELILIDNGSLKETSDYLDHLPHRVIRNKENVGCAKAWNQGLEAASGEYCCIVNNDIEVPRGWLRKLQEYYEAHDYWLISPSMREGALDYDLDAYNDTFRKMMGERVFEHEFRGTALFASRSVWERLEGFDPHFQGGKYEDEDLFMRICQAGGQTAVITTVLIHHYGSKTINLLKQSKENTYESKNRDYFIKKWKKRYLWRKLHRWKIQRRRRWIERHYGVQY